MHIDSNAGHINTGVTADFASDGSNDSNSDSIEFDQDSDSRDSEKVLNLAFPEPDNSVAG